MFTSNTTTLTGSSTRRSLWIACLVVLLCLFLPTSALAASPDPSDEGPDTCAQCHLDQSATWGDCPHAQAGVTCEVCHGSYVPGHPQQGLMQLPVDASCCHDCHTATYDQWHETSHAGANVQCASCHMPHSQVTRLDSEELCGSCHREVVDDRAHHSAGVHCVNCHLPSLPASAPSADVRLTSGGTAPNHSFKPAAEACADCHGKVIHETAFHEAPALIDYTELSPTAERERELAYELEDAKRSNRSLQAMSVVSLGFGLGVGGVLGAIFVLIIGHIGQESDRQ